MGSSSFPQGVAGCFGRPENGSSGSTGDCGPPSHWLSGLGLGFSREVTPEDSCLDHGSGFDQHQGSIKQRQATLDSLGLSDCTADSASSAQSGWNPPGALLCEEGLEDDQNGRASMEDISLVGRNLAAALSRQDSGTSDESFPRAETSTEVEASFSRVVSQVSKLQDSLIGHLASIYHYSDMALSLGTTYMQRLACVDHMLLGVARASSDFAPLVAHIFPEAMPERLCAANPTFTARSAQLWLISVHLCCINIAAKLIESPPFHNLLQTMLTHVHARPIPAAVAEELEMKCLKSLDWRLGPFFTH